MNAKHDVHDQPNQKPQTNSKDFSGDRFSGDRFSGDRFSGDRFPVCPVCGAELIEIRQKFQCSRCHTICETCCEGGRG